MAFPTPSKLRTQDIPRPLRQVGRIAWLRHYRRHPPPPPKYACGSSGSRAGAPANLHPHPHSRQSPPSNPCPLPAPEFLTDSWGLVRGSTVSGCPPHPGPVRMGWRHCPRPALMRLVVGTLSPLPCAGVQGGGETVPSPSCRCAQGRGLPLRLLPWCAWTGHRRSGGRLTRRADVIAFVAPLLWLTLSPPPPRGVGGSFPHRAEGQVPRPRAAAGGGGYWWWWWGWRL